MSRELNIRNIVMVGHEAQAKDIVISGDRIIRISPHSATTTGGKDELGIRFNSAIAFPGLINSHDHLEFNLYPSLGDKCYLSYIDWSHHIYQQHSSLIHTIESIPVPLRLAWGKMKNLICGVTTVMHHGRWYKELPDGGVDVVQGCQSLHSVQLEKWWRLRLNFPLKHLHRYRKTPVVIHIGEGRDESTEREIDRLIHWNYFGRKIIGVHGICMNESQAKYFQALVWCPVSNRFLFGKTAPVDVLKNVTRILVGTDSTLTGDWNLWNHLRFARQLRLLTDRELFNTVTRSPVSVWPLKDGGELKEGKVADLVIARRKANDVWESFFLLNPEDILLVIKDGAIILWDKSLQRKVDVPAAPGFVSTFFINNQQKYIRGNFGKDLQCLIKNYEEITLPIRFSS